MAEPAPDLLGVQRQSALSTEPGRSAVCGVTTNGKGIVPVELHGSIDALRINGGAKAAGGGFDKI